jgi:lysylphosphatidylglycerol synthetase-like protein (DUF2156 family)
MEPTFEQRVALLREFGNFSSAYSVAYQSNMSYFGDESGFLAYKTKWGINLVLADPIASAERCPALLRAYLDAFPRSCFWQISENTASILESFGFYINEMGTESRIDLQFYNFRGKSREHLRSAANRIKTCGYTIREEPISAVDATHLEKLSVSWRRSKTVKNREVVFLNRTIKYADEPDVRKFFCFDRDGKIVAFIFFDPVYQGGEVTGYLAAFKRTAAHADGKTGNAMVKTAIEVFQQEGKRHLFIGLSPLAHITDGRFHHNPLTRWLFLFFYNNVLTNKYIYAFKGHDHYKSQFHGEIMPTYYASSTPFNLHRHLALLRASRIL